jgi:hypothetical protein
MIHVINSIELVTDFGDDYVVTRRYGVNQLTLKELNIEFSIAQDYLGVKKITLQHVEEPSGKTVVMQIWPKPQDEAPSPSKEELRNPEPGEIWLWRREDILIRVLEVSENDARQTRVKIERTNGHPIDHDMEWADYELGEFWDHVQPGEGLFHDKTRSRKKIQDPGA